MPSVFSMFLSCCLMLAIQITSAAPLASHQPHNRSFIPDALSDLHPDSKNWQLTHEEQDIQVFTQSLQQSGFSAFKAVAELDQPLSAVFATLSDPFSCPDWVDGCIGSGPMIGEQAHIRYGYAINDLPWPFSHREIAVQIHSRYHIASDQTAQVDMLMMADGSRRQGIPDSTVQITDTTSIYRLEQTSDSRTRLTWIQHTDPSGSLPSWLVNAKLIELPTHSIPKLETLAGSKKYKEAKLLIDDGQLVDIVLGNNAAISSFFEALTPPDDSATQTSANASL